MKKIRNLAILSIALAGVPVAADQQNEKKEVALTYLKHLGSGALDLKKDTALSQHCSNQRLKQLDTRVKFVRANSFRPGDTLSVLNVKTEGQLAAALVKAENPASLLSLRIHTVALIKKDNRWLAAPLPGLFANAGYGYSDEIEKSARSLERWMASEKILLETKHRNKTTTELSSDLAPLEKAANHDKMTPEQSASHLIEQCRKRNIRSILASMGAASGALESTLETTIQSVEHGLKTTNDISYWHFLTNRSVLAEVIEFDEKHSVVAIGFYDPKEDSSWYQYDIFYFPILTIESKTFAQLDPDFTTQEMEAAQDKRPTRPHRHNESSKKRKLATALITKNPGIASASPEQLLDRFIRSIEENNFSDFLRLITPQGDFIQDKNNHQSVIDSLGAHWNECQNMRLATNHSDNMTNKNIFVEQSIALAALPYTTKKRISEFKTLKVWMAKDDQGWFLVPPGIRSNILDDAQLTIVGKLNNQLEATEQKRQLQRATEYIKEVYNVTLPLQLKAPSQEQAHKALLDYRTQLKEADPQAALSFCAVVDGTTTTQIMKAFNLAHRGAIDHTANDQILGSMSQDRWHGISLRTESQLSGEHNYPLYLIANTDSGPRILIDLDFRFPTNKGRLLLNKRNWARLEQIMPEKSLKAIREIFDHHSKLSAQDIKAAQQSD